MLLPTMAAIRRALRRHQGLPPGGEAIPMWRLVAGELRWALQRLFARPGR